MAGASDFDDDPASLLAVGTEFSEWEALIKSGWVVSMNVRC
ncbi:hypothetical protein RESH_03079 [Rhodopirellula europaea SH398]|uniref:Uncharacterized protein n=1 Tax=Rhodopirellula europaea SH398 TaxID=1263868 RepID=M5S3R9_9BACT|nr:hypothetical protein RESH_03079 [Rhodopirellula europaea SH398]